MSLISILKLDSFLKAEVKEFTCINLGNYCIKGLKIKGKKAEKYFLEKNEGLENTIKKLKEQKKISTKNVKISVKDPFCLVRYFSFPKTDKKKLKQAIFYELSKFIPFSPSEVYFDLFILQETKTSEFLILLAVAKKDFIDKVISAFEKNNLTVSEISLDSVVVANLFLNNYEENKTKNSCVLDIGYSFSTMTIFHKNIPFLTRDIKSSTKDIFQVISRVKDVPLEDVENWALGLENKKELIDLCRDSIFDMCKEIKSSFDYFEVNKGEHIDNLYFTGGLAFLEGITEVFKEKLDIETKVLDVIPKGGVELAKDFVDKDFNFSKNSFATSFGLSL